MKLNISSIYTELHTMNIVTSEADFCINWLGRGAGYMRTLRFTKSQASPYALAYCAAKLHRLSVYLSSDTKTVHWSQQLKTLADRCNDEANALLLNRKTTSARISRD